MDDTGVELSLVRGQNVALPEGQERVLATVEWTESDGAHEVELSALLLDPAGRVRGDHDMVFYNQPESPDGSTRYLGPVQREAGSEARMSFDLEAVSSDVAAIALVGSVEPDFDAVRGLTVSFADGAGTVVAHFVPTGLDGQSAVHLADLYRRAGAWRLRAVGQGWASGLAGVARDFGITVDDAPETAAHPASDEPTGGEPATAPAPAPAAAPPPRRSGVRTTRQKPIRPPEPQLADDPSWQPARLFPVAGIGGSDEQESRATSALLATMVGVRRFGRAITSQLGAPAGPVETFLEVSFKHGESTARPDGVLKVTRAGVVWTALVEVKTGAGQLRKDQVERYLDVARSRGYDAVVTISNEIAEARGRHPVAVDGRKTKKVALHHLSWSEVLHEARMLLVHRGSDDALQAWITHELIRYLEHPRSGADLFADMGAAWVPVRQAVAAGTVRASDTKVPVVAETWGKLVRHLCLQLTAELGVEVKEVLPRGPAGEVGARRAAGAAQLAADGTLSATIKVPGAAGPLTVVADVRTSQVKVGIDVPAPGEWGAQRRISWVVRQLKDAPAGLLVETRFAGSVESTCEQLKDVRETPTVLLPDRSVDVVAFRLALVTPLGTKRSGVKGAFVSSVATALEDFYRTVAQPITPWTASAPQLPTETQAQDAST